MPSLLNSLFDESEKQPLTVSQLNESVKRELERRFATVWIEGEIIDFYDAHSGHWYFTLHDGDSQIKAACYKGTNWRIRFMPFDGLQVRVRGKLSLYAPRGEYQILVESLEPVGEGALKVAFEQIKLKLGKEGLFAEELKRQLPIFPRRIGVVTSPNGAAFHDILNVLSRRTKSVSIVLVPTRVQGETAPEEIREAILLANRYNRVSAEKERIDVLIVGRGGGSAEDLWAFNEERLARTIRASEIPIISAVGHEIDYTIADLVADRRAPTPSAAAEIVAESEYQIESFIRQKTQDLVQSFGYRLLTLRSDLQELAHAPVFSEFPAAVRDRRYELEDRIGQLGDAVREGLESRLKNLERLVRRMSPIRLAQSVNRKKTALAVLGERQHAAVAFRLNQKQELLNIEMASLDALSPLAVLDRGYSVVKNKNGDILREASNVENGEDLDIQLASGRLLARVEKIKKDG